jgi:hypothetical protein
MLPFLFSILRKVCSPPSSIYCNLDDCGTTVLVRSEHGSKTDHHLLSEKKLTRAGVEEVATAKVMGSEQSKSSGCSLGDANERELESMEEQKERVNIIDVNGRYAWIDIWTGQQPYTENKVRIAYHVQWHIKY